MPFEAVVVRPKGELPLPAVLFPHGGPHSAYPAAYSNLVAFQAAQGYAVIAVNYRCHSTTQSMSCSALPTFVDSRTFGRIGSNQCITSSSTIHLVGFSETTQSSFVYCADRGV